MVDRTMYVLCTRTRAQSLREGRHRDEVVGAESLALLSLKLSMELGFTRELLDLLERRAAAGRVGRAIPPRRDFTFQLEGTKV